MNRCLDYILGIERDQREHKKRVARVLRSREVYPAANDEAIQQGITLTQTGVDGTVYILGDHRMSVWFYAATNTVFRKAVGAPRSEMAEGLPELDIYDVVLLFVEGKFH